MLCGGCTLPDAPVAFPSSGGEAWSFHKQVEATVVPGACEAVAFRSPAGTAIARPHAGRVVARVPLRSGDNPLTAECRKDGAAHGDPARQSWVVPLGDDPSAHLRLVPAEGGLVLDAGASERAPSRPAPIAAYEWRAREGNPAPLPDLPAQGRRLTLMPPATDGDYAVTLRVTDVLGRADESTAMFRVRGGRIEEIDPARSHPGWIDNAVLYGVLPYFFGPRGFADVTARLDELAALGVTVLWLSPVTASPPDDFGYAVTDHFRLRPTFGDETALRALIQAAHARGLRVILDFVPNHVSERHRYFAEVAEHGRRSAYFDFFARTAAGEVMHYFDWRNLKNLNYDNPEVRNLVIAGFVHWIRAFDVDGFRVDAAWGPRQRAPEFWPRWRTELKRIKPDILLLAEAPARDRYYARAGFDAAYDWTDRLGEWAWRAAFEDEAHTAGLLRQEIAASLRDPATLTFRFLNNNDTGARFVTRYGVARTRVAAAMLLTLPGLPSLYTGDEVGAAFEPYDEGPPLAWNDPNGLRRWYERLISLRRALPALRSGTLQFIDLPSADNVLAYLRPGGPGEESVLVLLSYTAAPQNIRVPHHLLPRMARGQPVVDVLNDEEFRIDAQVRPVFLPGHGVRILRLPKSR